MSSNLLIILMLSVVLLWGVFINKYCIAPVSVPARAYPITEGQRLEYVERSKGNALWMILYVNDAMQTGILDPAPVYGVWMEDMRLYCAFPLVGNIYGWGSLYNVSECRTPADLVQYLQSVGCHYIMWDGQRSHWITPYMGVRVLSASGSSEWLAYFEAVPIDPGLTDAGCRIWRIK